MPRLPRRLLAYLLLLALALTTLLPATPTSASGALLQISKSGPSAPVPSGDWLVYTLNYRCASITADCQNVVVSDVLPPELASGAADVELNQPSFVQARSYDPATRTATWTFVPTLPAGTSGTLTLRVRFPAGSTLDGTTATNRARMSASNAPTVLSNPSTVTARAVDRSFVEKTLLAGGVVDGETTYRLQVCQPAGSNRGGLNLTNVTLSDRLPPGTSFVTATKGGVYDALSNTVTWPVIASVPVSSGLSCTQRFLTVRYGADSFAAGDIVNNELQASGTPVGGSILTKTTNLQTTLVPAGPGPGSLSKTGPSSVYVGQIARYNLLFQNTGTVPMTDTKLVEAIPDELEVTRIYIGDNNRPAGTVPVSVEYQLNGGATWTSAGTFATPGAKCINVAPNSGGGCSGTITLSGGERITGIRWNYGNLPIGFAATSGTPTGIDARVLSTPINGTIVNQAGLSSSYGGVSSTTGSNRPVRVIPPAARPSVQKSANPAAVNAGGLVTYTLRLDQATVDPTNPVPLLDPVLADLLASDLIYETGSATVTVNVPGAPTPLIEVVPDYLSSGRTLLRWSWNGYTMPPGQSIEVQFRARVRQGTPTGFIGNTVTLAGWDNPNEQVNLDACQSRAADTLDYDIDGNTSELTCNSSIANVNVSPDAVIVSVKLVRGQADTSWHRYPDSGLTSPGGMADYQMVLTNTGTISLTDLTILDILPWVGDRGVIDPQDRLTQWRPYLIQPIRVPAGVAVFYSTQTNPCRGPDLGLDAAEDAAGCSAPVWSSIPPEDLTTVQSIKLEFGQGFILRPQDSVTIEWPMRAPLGGTMGEIAWNSFGYYTQRVDTSAYLDAAEPIKVGIARQEGIPPFYGDFVWLDADTDGVQDASEAGVNGVRVELFRSTDLLVGNADDRRVDYTATGADSSGNSGYYRFTDLNPGFYYAKFFPPIGYTVTLSGTAADGSDSDVDPATGLTELTELTNGEQDLSWDLGIYRSPTAAIGNYVWFDRDGDGQQNNAVSDGLNGVRVNLYRAGDTTPLSTTLTRSDIYGQPGYYLFDKLTPGSYFLEFVPPSGASFSAQDALSTTNTLDSDANIGTGRTATFALAAEQYDPSWDAGIIMPTGPLSLGDIVWNDIDNDGRYEPLLGERGIDNVVVNLYRDLDNNGAAGESEFFATTSTRTSGGVAGLYRFQQLPSGTYIVQIDPANSAPGGVLNGYSSSTGNDPAPDPDDNRNGDDNGTPAGALGVVSQPIALSANAEPDGDPDQDGDSDPDSNLTLDFGFFGSAMIGNRVWYDLDADGVQDLDERGVANVTVQLFDGLGATQIQTATTDSSGHYGFSGLEPGDYLISFLLPAGYGFSPRDSVLTDTIDSDVDPTSGRTISTTLTLNEDDPTWDAGLTSIPAAIGDRAWIDSDYDGVQDAGETSNPGGVLSGITVTLRLPDGTAIATTTTDVDGYYTFTNQQPDSYYLRFESLPTGYFISPQNRGDDDLLDSDADLSTRRTATTTLLPGENDPNWDLGIYNFSALGDRVWNDIDRDGVQDGGEAGVPNVTVRLFRVGQAGAVTSTTTNGSGFYTFTNLIPADYFVEFVPSGGWAISPRDLGGDDTLDSDISLVTGQTISITLSAGESDSSWDAGLYQTASIGDYVWIDRNSNGIQDASENEGVRDFSVQLYDGTGSLVNSTATDSSGRYRFSGLIPGDYYVRFAPPEEWLISPRDVGGDDALDSDADLGSGLRTITTTLIGGENDLSWDLGVFLPAALGDRVWHDQDGDGVQDAGEPGIAGISVTLRNAANAVVSTTTTIADGVYRFEKLYPGDYYVEFGATPGYSEASPRDAEANDLLDSDADPATRATPLTTLVALENDLSWDFGVFNRAALGDRVWFDSNGDGVQDAGETTGAPGVTVTLQLIDGTSVATTTTDASGLYSFTGLMPGEYYVRFFGIPDGYAVSPPDNVVTDTIDSDASPRIEFDGSGARLLVGQTDPLVLRSGDNNLTLDMGLFELITVGDRVWLDTNANGGQDPGELTGVPSVQVELYDDNNILVDVMFTDATGYYTFTGLYPDSYYVRFYPPTGYSVSPRDRGGDDTIDSDGLLTTPFTTATFTRLAGEEDLTRDLGLYQTAAIGDRVWHDVDADGEQDASETGIAGVGVTLRGAGLNLVFGDGDDIITTTTTNATGYYTFTNQIPGSYRVEFAMPAGFDRVSPQNSVLTDSIDSDVDPITRIGDVTQLDSNESDPSWDMGVYRLATIGDRVWIDGDGDGNQDAGETTGVAGVTVTLRDGGNTPISTTLTNATGSYSFTGLVPGVYSLVFTPTAGYTFTWPDNPPATDSADSDAERLTGATITTTLVSGENDPGWDAGLFQLAAIGNRYWEDLNGNGRQDAGEPGIEGITVTLRWGGPNASIGSGSDDQAYTMTTDASGFYTFTERFPGAYRLEFDVPTTNFTYTLRNRGDLLGDSDPVTSTGITSNTLLSSGQVDETWDAGVYQLLSLGNRVWNDLNNNGLFDAGESGLDGITVTLLFDRNNDANISGGETTPIQTTTTSNGGAYLFTGLISGTYQVRVAAPAGYRSSTGSNASPAGPYEPASDPDANANDSDDNGTQGAPIRSPLVTLRPATEPITETDLTMPAATLNPSRDENSNLSVDIGLFQASSLGNWVWLDRNADGIQSTGEVTGVAGVTVTLLSDTQATISTTTSGPNGYYTFTNLISGSYYVSFTLPAGYERSPLGFGSIFSDTNADLASGRTALITLTANMTDTTWDAGLFRRVNLGNLVWHDLNNNGQRNPGEPGIAGVTMTLYRDADASGVYSAITDTLVMTTTTDATGIYTFSNLLPGDYIVQVDPENFLLGGPLHPADGNVRYESSTGNGATPDPDAGDIDGDDNGAPRDTNGVFAQAVTLLSESEPTGDGDGNNGNLTVDFGFYRPAALGNFVWEDRDGDGIQEGGESGVPGVTVTLRWAGFDGLFDDVGDTTSVTTTDASGEYYFRDLQLGVYRVEFSLPPNYAFTRRSGATPADGDSDADPSPGATLGHTQLITLTSVDTDLRWDAGIYELLSLGNRVWEDTDNDGRFNNGENGRDGITVTLYRDLNNNSVIDAGAESTPIQTTTTSNGGAYLFSGLISSTYQVRIAPSPGYRSSTGTNASPSGPFEPAPAVNDLDSDDTGSAIGAAISSSVFRLTPGNQPLTPADESDPTLPAATSNLSRDENSNLTVDFGIFRPATIGDYVWHDFDADGTQDGGESGLAGVTVTLMLPGGTPISTTTTSASGLYSFTNLISGSYYISFTMPAGFDRASPRDLAGDSVDSDADPTTLRTIDTDLAPGENDSNWDMGLYRLARIGDYVWEDLDGDGRQDAGESGVPGVTVTLFSGAIPLSTTTTGATGAYTFTGLVPGAYSLVFTPTDGYTFTRRDLAGDTIDSDADPSSGATIATTLDSGESDPTWDAGLYRPATYGDFFWEDRNGDGQQDAGEPGIPGITVTLRYAGLDGIMLNGDDQTFTTTTGATGAYTFTGLVPGSYRAEFGPAPSDFIYTRQDSGVDTGDSDVPLNGTTPATTLDSGETDLTWDAGIHQMLSVGNRVWEDLNNNGILDPGERGINAVMVTLYRDANSNGIIDAGIESSPVLTTSTSGDGAYLFNNLVSSTWQIRIAPPPGYRSSSGVNGSLSGPFEPAPAVNAGDSDDTGSLSGALISSALFQLTPGNQPLAEPDTSLPFAATNLSRDENSNLTVDFGIFRPAALGDHVWFDRDADGIQDGDETGIGGVTLTLRLGGTTVATTTTDANGYYSFTNLISATYRLRIVPPPGYVLTSDDQGGDNGLDSDFTADGDISTDPFDLGAGQTDLSWDAGFYRYLNLGNIVWNDRDNDGLREAGEPGINDVVVNLFPDLDQDGVYSPTIDGAFPIASTNTANVGGVDGVYLFEDLDPGSYFVQLDPANFDPGNALGTSGGLAAFVGSTGNDPAPDPDNNGDDDDNGGPRTGLGIFSQAITLRSGDEPTLDGDGVDGNLSVDFGLYRPAALGNFVWEDRDGDGEQDGGMETGIQGVTVRLLDSGDAVLSTTTTDASGIYTFTNLLSGSYRVEFVLPAGYAFSGQDQSADNAVDSDADGGTGRTDLVSLGEGQSDLSWDGGLYRLLSLGNRVWEDFDNSGDWSVGEPGLDGVIVRLFDVDNVNILTTTTSDGGYYLFTGLEIGDYRVEISGLPAGYRSSTGNDPGPDPDDNGDRDDNGEPSGLVIASQLISLSPGAEPLNEDDQLPAAIADPARDEGSNLTLDFGVFRPAALGNFVWADRNGDGVQDLGEIGIGGVSVTLLNSGGTPILTTTTDANGVYTFTDLISGSYAVAFGVPSGYAPSPADHGDDDALDNDRIAATGRTALFNLPPGAFDQSRDAGFYPLLSIGNRVWEDTDNDGSFEPGENGIDGVDIRLYREGEATPVLSTTTSNGGAYRFTGLISDSYVVEIAPPAGYRSSTGSSDPISFTHEPAPAPTPFADSDDNGTTAGAVIRTQAFALRPGAAPIGEPDPAAPSGPADPTADQDSNLTLDFGLVRPAALGNFVWADRNGDGVQDAGESGVSGMTVTLYSGLGNPVGLMASTDTSGFYTLTGLVPGDYYVVFGNLPAGYNFTRRDSALADDSSDSDADRGPGPSIGRSHSVTLASGESNPTLDAGINQLVSIGDFVWEDLNADGVQDVGEQGVAGVTVTLFSALTDSPVGTPYVTLGDGFYEFTSLPPGDYYLVFTPTLGWTFSPQNSGSNGGLDSDVDPATGQTSSTSLSSGETDLSWDAGLYRPAAIGDRVWNDRNGNGVQDTGEGGIEGIAVTLYDAEGFELEAKTTNFDGEYLFAKLRPGIYRIGFGELPAGYIFTTPNSVLSDTLDSDADSTTGGTDRAELESGESDLSWDAGIYLPAALGGLIWDDPNIDGIRDSGETPVPGISVTLYRDAQAISTTLSGGDGSFRFWPLPAGDYHIVVSKPISYSISPQNQGGDDTLDSDVDQAPGATIGRSHSVSLNPGDDISHIDTGLYRLAALGNVVWLDRDADGIHDGDEPGVPGVVVRLLHSDGTLLATRETDANGRYSFNNLEPASYYIEFMVPSGYQASPPGQGSDSSADSDADPSSGRTPLIFLSPGESDQTWYLGISQIVPTAVILSSFGATWVSQDVLLRWTTASELDSQGFRVYRSENGQRADAVLITAQLIPARGIAGAGTSYTWLDSTAEPGARYSYWLEEVSYGRTSQLYGPARVETPLYLPLMLR
jgi:uncharacterized surface anchored protein